MAIAQKGAWWRTSKLGPVNEVLRGAVPTASRWVFVGSDSGIPRIYTVESSDFETVTPTFTARTPGGSSILYDVDYISGEDILSAVGNGGSVESSTNNGTSWSQTILSGLPSLRGIVGKTGDATSRFIAVGIDVIFGQDNLGVWTSRWTGSQVWLSVAHNATAGFVAVGNAGFGSQSTTGANGTWSAPYAITDAQLWEVAASADYVIAVGLGGRVFRSSTGLSGSWTQLDLSTTKDLRTVAWLASANRWAVAAFDGTTWTSEDNGANWSQNDYQITDEARGINADANRASIVGENGGIYISYDQEQVDPVAVAAPAPPLAFSANETMALDAIRRLSTQFRE